MKSKSIFLIPLMFVFLAVFVQASSVTVSLFYDNTASNYVEIMQGDTVGVIVSADSIFENSMIIKLNFLSSGPDKNILDVYTTSDSYSNYVVIGPAVYSAPGTYVIRGIVTGASGDTEITDLNLKVLAPTPGNSAPFIFSDPISQVNEGQNYVYDVDASDADGDVLLYSLTQAPSWLSINSQTGLITGVAPSVDADYEFIATVKVSDGSDFDTQTFTVAVMNVPINPPTNSLPVITSTPITQVNEGQNYVYDVQASDADGNILTYSLNQAPSWLSINSQTGLISGVAPFVVSNSQFSVTVHVSDGVGVVSQSYILTVVNVPVFPPANAAPVITSNPITQVNEGNNYVYDVQATDADGNVLTYSLLQAPNWLSINSQTGLITGTAPQVAANTQFTVSVQVSDGVDVATQSYVLTVINVVVNPTNSLPVITSSPVTQVNEGLNYVYDVQASDADGDTLTYSLSQAPNWLAINSQTGLITGTAPQVSVNTPFAVTVVVSDGVGSVSQSYVVTVVNIPVNPPANNLPVITSTPVTQVNEGQVYTYDVNANDADGNTLTYSLSQAPSWLSINSSTGLISGTAPQVAANTAFVVTVVVSDGFGSVAQSYTLTVINVVIPPSDDDDDDNGGSVGGVRTLPLDDFYNAQYLSQFNTPTVINEEDATPIKDKTSLTLKIALWLLLLILILVILIIVFWLRSM